MFLEERGGWEEYLAQLKVQTTPLIQRQLTETEKWLPDISNVVSTFSMLPSSGEYTLPLAAIASQRPCSQYAPEKFAACVMKQRDAISEMTSLVFPSGRVVLVASRTIWNAIYRSHAARSIIEQTRCVMKDIESGEIVHGSLAGRLLVNDFKPNNIVGDADLGFPVDLKAMCAAAPMSCSWMPDLFAGLKCQVWLTPDYRCHCHESHANPTQEDELLQQITEACSCCIKLLIFSTGSVVIPGGRSVDDINAVFYRLRQVAAPFRMNAEQFAAAAAAKPSSSKRRRIKK